MKTYILIILLLCCSSVSADPRQQYFRQYKQYEKRTAIKYVRASQNPNAYWQLVRENQYQVDLYRSYLASLRGSTIRVQVVN